MHTLSALDRATAQAEELLSERDMLVIKAFAEGASLRAIAEAARMSHVGVKKLVDRYAPDIVVTDENGEVLTIIEAKLRAVSAEQKRAYNIELNKRRKGGASS